MTPIHFREENTTFGAPAGGELDPSQCFTIPAWKGKAEGGCIDGSPIVVVAWTPSPDELAELIAGGAVYLTCIGGLPPHTIQTSFHHATHF